VTYHAGQRVRVAAREHAGHHRTPAYAKGKSGRVERIHGAFKNPETRAYGEDGLPEKALYMVALDAGTDTGARIYVDIFEHWLEEAE